MKLICHLYTCFGEVCVYYFCPFLIGLFVFLLGFEIYFMQPGNKSFARKTTFKYFSHSVVAFIPLTVFTHHKFSVFNKTCLLLFFILMNYVFVSYIKLFAFPKSERFFPYIFLWKFYNCIYYI
jgi:hypothetical protein